MATYVYDVSPYFAVGATVGAYLRSSYPQSLRDTPDGVAAPIAATATAVVSSTGTVSYTGLADGTEYWLGTGLTPYDYVSVRTTTPSSSGGSAVTAPRVVSGGSMGATPSLAMLATDARVVYVGTLTANATLTITSLTAGQSVAFLLTQDATGGRTFSITVGASTAAVPINSGASQYTVAEATYDGTDLYVKGA